MQFVCFKRPPRKDFAATMTGEESEIMSRHFAYMKQLLERGVLIVAGPVTTGEFGLSVFEAESDEDAKEIVNNDPAVACGLMKPEIFPYRVSLLRK
jgi:uncharacterized protein YciI